MGKMIVSQVITKSKGARSTCCMYILIINSVTYFNTNLAVQFQNGELVEDQEIPLSCGLCYNDAQRVIPVLASDTLIYTGRVAEQNAYNTFLAVRNKKTNKVRLNHIATSAPLQHLRNKT